MTANKILLICIISVGYFSGFSWVIYYFCPLLPVELPLTLAFVEVALVLLLGLNQLIEKE